VSFLSSLVTSPGSVAQSGGELPECSDKFLVFFYPFSRLS
jgi:hypothetical protein